MAQQPPAKPQQQQAAPNLPPVPNPYTLNMMIRSAVIALNQANKTGNYSVLLDLGAPAFRASNNSARLAQIFAALRQRNLDLSPILFFTPKLVQQPVVAPNGILRLAGFFPTTPERVNFDIYMQWVGQEWQLFGIGLSTFPADVTAATPGNNGAGAAQGGSENGSAAANGRAARPAQEPTAAKPAIAPPPERRPQRKPSPSPAPAAPQTEETGSKVQNETTSNAVRIDLSKAATDSPVETPDGTDAEGAVEAEKPAASGFWNSINPFSPN